MTSKPVALLLADLGVTKTHSRPHVSNDNPYSEAQFKTLKYCPEFPERFGRRPPQPPALPQAAWINPPSEKKTSKMPQGRRSPLRLTQRVPPVFAAPPAAGTDTQPSPAAVEEKAQ
jgi:transposase InsO family protein